MLVSNFCYLAYHSMLITLIADGFFRLFPGVRARGNISSGLAIVRGSQGPRGLLHHTLRGSLREDRHEDPDF